MRRYTAQSEAPSMRAASNSSPGQLLDERGQDEHGDRAGYRDVHGDEPPHLVEQPDALHHPDDIDRCEPDGNHQPGDEPEVQHRRGTTVPPARAHIPPSIRSAGRSRSRCPSRARCCGTRSRIRRGRARTGIRRACPCCGRLHGEAKISRCGLNELTTRIQIGPSTANDHAVRIRYVTAAGRHRPCLRSARVDVQPDRRPGREDQERHRRDRCTEAGIGLSRRGSPEMPMR